MLFLIWKLLKKYIPGAVFLARQGKKYKENPNLLYMMRLRSLLVLKPYQYGYLRWVA
jgi:hypothetical protein